MGCILDVLLAEDRVCWLSGKSQDSEFWVVSVFARAEVSAFAKDFDSQATSAKGKRKWKCKPSILEEIT
jgi:hypothetical protein